MTSKCSLSSYFFIFFPSSTLHELVMHCIFILYGVRLGNKNEIFDVCIFFTFFPSSWCFFYSMNTIYVSKSEELFLFGLMTHVYQVAHSERMWKIQFTFYIQLEEVKWSAISAIVSARILKIKSSWVSRSYSVFHFI